MALIGCPECGGRVSDRAAACPHCVLPSHFFASAAVTSSAVEGDAFVPAVGGARVLAHAFANVNDEWEWVNEAPEQASLVPPDTEAGPFKSIPGPNGRPSCGAGARRLEDPGKYDEDENGLFDWPDIPLCPQCVENVSEWKNQRLRGEVGWWAIDGRPAAGVNRIWDDHWDPLYEPPLKPLPPRPDPAVTAWLYAKGQEVMRADWALRRDEH